MRNWELPLDDALEAKACSGVALTYQPMLGISFQVEQLTPQVTVTDIGIGALARDMGSVGHKDANVVQHARLFYEPGIYSQFRMLRRDRKRFVCHIGHVR